MLATCHRSRVTIFRQAQPSPHKKEDLTDCRRNGHRLFHHPPVLFTFLTVDSFAIGRQEYSGLPNGLGGSASGSTGPRLLLGRRDRQTMRVQAMGPHPAARYSTRFLTHGFHATAGRPAGAAHADPVTPRAQPPTGITRADHNIIRFSSPPLRNIRQVLRCFTCVP